MPITQQNRSAAIGTPLGEDVLVLRRFSGTEPMSRLFQFDADLLSEKPDINFDDIIGQNVTVRLTVKDDKDRFFNGFVSQFVQTGMEGRLHRYQATIVPWLWFLTRTADCRIFQDMTVPDILEKVFKAHGFDSYELGLSGSYGKWEYCVQYRETDFNFVSRLMEQEGIYYFFTHENGKHKLVLADSASAHEDFPGYGEIVFRPPEDTRPADEEINDWVIHKELQTGTFAHTDFNFQKPKTKLDAKSNVPRQYAAADFEIFDYPGEYEEAKDGGDYAKIRIQELQARYEALHGQGNARGIAAGCTFTLTDHPREDQNRKYLILSALHSIEEDVADSGSGGQGAHYHCSFTVMDAADPYRAARITPKPLIQGPQTAMVVGTNGEEIYTDKYGRVKVQFPWDRYGKADENASCWIRVAQVWAGKKWGAIYTPRIGQEVIVEFLEGDPDRPIITGRVYNDDAMPPYDLPGEKTKSTIKTNSSKGGSGFNEIRFEDKKGDEQIFIHAEKDKHVRVKNSTREFVGNNRHLIVKNDQYEKVEADKHSIVKGDRLSKIEGDRGATVKGDRLVSIEGDDNLTVKGDQDTKVTGDVNLKGGQDCNEEARQKISVKAGTDFHEKAGQNYAMDAGMNVHIKGGMTVVIEAGMQLSLKAGASFIDIGPAGISISGAPLVMINSGGSAASGSGSSPTAPAAPEAPDAPEEAKEAVDAKPGEKDEAPPAPQPPKPVTYSASATVLKQAAKDGTPFCEKCEEARQRREARETA